MRKCCPRCFQRGPNLCKGRRTGSWKLDVCQNCSSSPWREIPPSCTTKIVAHLDGDGISHERNAQGSIKWPQAQQSRQTPVGAKGSIAVIARRAHDQGGLTRIVAIVGDFPAGVAGAGMGLACRILESQ